MLCNVISLFGFVNQTVPFESTFDRDLIREQFRVESIYFMYLRKYSN